MECMQSYDNMDNMDDNDNMDYRYYVWKVVHGCLKFKI